MRWREVIWLVLATSALSALIVGSVRSEIEAARERYAADTLQAIAGHVTLAMQRAAQRGENPRAWRFPLVGPGSGTPGINSAGGTPLAKILPDAGWLAPDPWGRSYAVVLAGGQNSPYPVVLTTGPDGAEVDLAHAARRWTTPILWPTAP